MSEDERELRRRERAQAQEFPETMALFAKLRVAMVEKMLATKLSERDAREDLYTRIQALDALTSEMQTLLTAGVASEAVRKHIEELATTKPE